MRIFSSRSDREIFNSFVLEVSSPTFEFIAKQAFLNLIKACLADNLYLYCLVGALAILAFSCSISF